MNQEEKGGDKEKAEQKNTKTCQILMILIQFNQ